MEIERTDKRDVLRLVSLSMHNFRNYEDGELKFSQDPNKTITIFHGSMSSGKTTIMNAIHWCLYGKEPHFINEGEGKPLINQKALNETKLAKSIDVSVEITFSSNDGMQFAIKRTLIAYRKTDLRTKVFNSEVNGLIDAGFKIEKMEHRFSYLDREAGGWQHIENEDSFKAQVERLLPEDLSTFVFFNGEMLDKFFSTLQNQNIRNGIERVSGLGIVDSAITHLDSIENKLYRKKAMIDQGDLNYQIERKEYLQKKLDDITPKLNEKKQEEESLSKEKSRLREILRNNPEGIVKSEEYRLSQADENANSIRELLDKSKNARKDFVSGLFGKVLLLEPMKQCLAILHDAEQKGLTPPPIDPNYIHEKLAQNKCICGGDLSEGTPSREEVKTLLTKYKNSEIAFEAVEGRIRLSEMTQAAQNKQDIIDRLNYYREERKKYIQKSALNDSIIEGIKRRLQEYDIEKIRELGRRMEETDDKLVKLRGSISNLEGQKEIAVRTINEINDAVDKTTEKSEKARYWKDRQNLAKQAKDALEQLREVILNEIRSKVEKRTNEIFKALIARRWQLDKVQISGDYRIKVLDKDGVDNLKTLSAGQTLYLSLSFISALRDVTAINFPMVIDSPFGKVSGQERVWAAEDLPRFLPGTQVTFLVTDTEYSSNVSNILTNETIPSIRSVLVENERIWKEFNLVLVNEDEISSRTEVREVE